MQTKLPGAKEPADQGVYKVLGIKHQKWVRVKPEIDAVRQSLVRRLIIKASIAVGRDVPVGTIMDLTIEEWLESLEWVPTDRLEEFYKAAKLEKARKNNTFIILSGEVRSAWLSRTKTEEEVSNDEGWSITEWRETLAAEKAAWTPREVMFELQRTEMVRYIEFICHGLRVKQEAGVATKAEIGDIQAWRDWDMENGMDSRYMLYYLEKNGDTEAIEAMPPCYAVPPLPKTTPWEWAPGVWDYTLEYREKYPSATVAEGAKE